MWFKALLPLMSKFRRARARTIRSLFPDINSRTVCDLGGSLHFWEAVQEEINPRDLTILNISTDGTVLGPQVRSAEQTASVVLYDGKNIPFENRSIDILICNSVLEHVPVTQRAGLVSEIRRVARNYVIQTPAREFPIEPHFVAPFIHWLPRSAGRIASHFTPWAIVRRHGRDATNSFFDEISLLSRGDLRDLFPSETIIVERVGFLPKSYIVIGQDTF